MFVPAKNSYLRRIPSALYVPLKNKQMKKVSSVFILILVAVFAAHAQSDKKATDILDKVSAKIKSYKTIRIDFSYSMENKKDKVKDSFKGNLLSKGDKYSLSIANQEILCDGKTTWTVMKDAKEVNINDAGGNEGFSPTKMLSDYSKDYKAKFVQEKGNTQVVELYPIAKGKNFIKIRLTIDKAKTQVSQFQYFDRNNSVFTYDISKFTTDQSADDKQFTFNKAQYPGFEVIDMR